MNIELPHVGESITEGIIGKWLVSSGDSVDKYDPLVEVITDKVSMEVPSPATGTISKILVDEGSTLILQGRGARSELTPRGTVHPRLQPDHRNPDHAWPRPPRRGIMICNDFIMI